jgi:hypothetical protein
MGYYTRVLSKRADFPTLAELQAVLATSRPDVELEGDDEGPGWTELVLSHRDEPEIAVIERNAITEGSLGASEIGEMLEEIRGGQPASAARWLASYLSEVKTIYAFQHLSGTDTRQGDEALRLISEAIWGRGQAILQADGEGFSNEDGHHILWQFSDTVSGPWSMAVLEGDRWVQFEMDLDNQAHRAAFLAGRVPPGVQPT